MVTLFTQWCIPLPPATHISLTLEQQIADELGGNMLGGAAEVWGGAGRLWWLWEWLDEKVLRGADRTAVTGL
jgi:hypothetical protein